MIATQTLGKEWYARFLACPNCGSAVETNVGIICTRCEFRESTGCDLRGERSRPVSIEHSRTPRINIDNALKKIELARPEITYCRPSAIRDSRELMSVINERVKPNGRVLDLGCGPRDQSIPISHLGHSYVGCDYSHPSADFLADAHAIPFADNTFDCVLSYAVLEHLHDPFVALSEINRVLKPKSTFVGTVSQGEPYHESFYHFTPWGLISLVSTVPNLEIVRLWGSMDTIKALSRMGRYPRVVRKILSQVDWVHRAMPILAPRKMRWSQQEKDLDALYRAGSICFEIVKK